MLELWVAQTVLRRRVCDVQGSATSTAATNVRRLMTFEADRYLSKITHFKGAQLVYNRVVWKPGNDPLSGYGTETAP